MFTNTFLLEDAMVFVETFECILKTVQRTFVEQIPSCEVTEI